MRSMMPDPTTRKHIPAIEAAWHPQRAVLHPVEVLREVMSALEENRPVQRDAAASLHAALRKYISGEHDITANLGLRPSKGKRAQLSIERKAARDSHIRAIFAQLPGTRTDRAKLTAALLTAKPPEKGLEREITEGDVMAHLAELHREHGSELPRSWPHILRVVDAGQ